MAVSFDGAPAEQGVVSALHQCDCKVKLHISPAYLMDPMAGVHDQLSRMLLRYSPQLQGVPLAFSKVKLMSQSGVIRHDEPNVHLQVAISALVFAPVLGQQLGTAPPCHIERSAPVGTLVGAAP